MKRLLFLLTAFLLLALPSCAKKVTVTIDGKVSPSQETLYLIINEDTAHAQLIPIENARFSVTITVEQDAFIRLHDYKEWPERSAFVLIPDSPHITIDWNSGAIEGSAMSEKLKLAKKEVWEKSPEGFHIDVFSDDQEAWARAREAERSMRERMLMEQKKAIEKVIKGNKNNIIPAWIVYCYHDILDIPLPEIIGNKKQKWTKHPVIKKLLESDKD